MTYLVTLTSKNQLTLPAAFSKVLRIARGARLTVTLEQDSIRIKPFSIQDSDVQGIVQKYGHNKDLSVADAMKLAGKKEAQRLARI